MGCCSRREFLWGMGGGLGGIALAQMLQAEGVRGEASITILTHQARDRDVREEVRGIAGLATIRKAPRAVRIFDI